MSQARLRNRPIDWVFVIAFGFFALTSFGLDVPLALSFGYGIDPGPFHALALSHYADADPLFVAAPRFLQIAVFISGFVFGPLYLYLV